jgi:large subunit ribosomal protein L28
MFGNRVSHAHNVTKRRWNLNLHKVHVEMDGTRKHVKVCASCIRSGRVTKAA